MAFRLDQKKTKNYDDMLKKKNVFFLPELGLLCCDDSHLQLRGLEVDGENSGQTRDGRLCMEDSGRKG